MLRNHRLDGHPRRLLELNHRANWRIVGAIAPQPKANLPFARIIGTIHRQLPGGPGKEMQVLNGVDLYPALHIVKPQGRAVQAGLCQAIGQSVATSNPSGNLQPVLNLVPFSRRSLQLEQSQ